MEMAQVPASRLEVYSTRWTDTPPSGGPSAMPVSNVYPPVFDINRDISKHQKYEDAIPDGSLVSVRGKLRLSEPVIFLRFRIIPFTH